MPFRRDIPILNQFLDVVAAQMQIARNLVNIERAVGHVSGATVLRQRKRPGLPADAGARVEGGDTEFRIRLAIKFRIHRWRHFAARLSGSQTERDNVIPTPAWK